MRVMATGRSDYPNQINNVLAFPGIFRGALDVRARQITEEMKIGRRPGDRRCDPATRSCARTTSSPRVFNRDVAPAVAAAVAETARAQGIAEAGDEVGFADTETHRIITPS